MRDYYHCHIDGRPEDKYFDSAYSATEHAKELQGTVDVCHCIDTDRSHITIEKLAKYNNNEQVDK